MANAEAKKLGAPPRPEKISKLANTGAISALSGTIFETSVSSLLDSSDFDSRSEIASFDFSGSGANKKLKKLFPQLGSATEIEAKIRPSKGNRESMFDKILKATRNAAFGYIPNFAGGALDEAVAREQAAGVPINQIRINQSGKLRNAQNPMGLAVTNTRDEPTGAIPNFAKGESGGFGGGAALTAIFAVQALAGLAGSFVEGDEKLQKLINVISTTITVLSTLSLLGPSIQGLRGKLDNFASSLPRTVTATGASGKTRQFAAPSRLAGAARFGSRALALAGPVGIAASIIVPLALEMGLFKDKTKEAAKAVEAYKNDLEALSDVEKKNAVTVLENQLRGLQALKAEQ